MAEESAKVFVGGNAVLLPQVVYSIGEALFSEGYETGAQLMQKAREVNLGEAEVIVLSFDWNAGGPMVVFSLLRPDPREVAAALAAG